MRHSPPTMIADRKRPSGFAMLALLAIAVSALRIFLAYSELSQTSDEPGHIATGMQFIDQGKFTYETLHPTLGRAATAILPYLDGARSHNDTIFWGEGNDILFGQGTYWRTLTLARLGILPFYFLSAFLLWSWAKKLYGESTAFFSVLFFSLVPPVLAHAGLATTDTPLAAGFLASAYALWWFLDSPALKRGIVLGIVIGLSAATKFSFLVFFPPAALLIVLYKFFVIRGLEGKPDRPIAKSNHLSIFLDGALTISLILLTACITIWGCFLFSYGPIPITDGSLTVTYEPGHSYPAPEFLSGISMIIDKNDQGHATYFMGKPQYDQGSPWFFPVALAVKTPVAMLLFIALAIYLIIYKRAAKNMDRQWRARALLPLLISAMLLAVVMPSNINIGLRHLLPIYPFLAMLAGMGAQWIWSKNTAYSRIILAALLIWTVYSSMSSDPDRLAYFNEFASASSSHPVLLDSDLDWGQDVDKLADTLKARGITFATIGYFGSADLNGHGIQHYEVLGSNARPNSEWVAVSKLYLYTYDDFKWLRAATPVARIGNTILLYHQRLDEYARLVSDNLENAERLADSEPSAENFTMLAVIYQQANRLPDCIAAGRKALALKPDDAEACNIIGVAYNEMSRWDSAISILSYALQIKPDYQLAKNNLIWAEREENQVNSTLLNLSDIATTQPSPQNFLNLSLAYYNAARYQDCISVAQKAIALKPDYVLAYNNICAANNMLRRFEDGKKAAEAALKIDPDNQLAKNNLKWSLDGMQGK